MTYTIQFFKKRQNHSKCENREASFVNSGCSHICKSSTVLLFAKSVWTTAEENIKKLHWKVDVMTLSFLNYLPSYKATRSKQMSEYKSVICKDIREWMLKHLFFSLWKECEWYHKMYYNTTLKSRHHDSQLFTLSSKLKSNKTQNKWKNR